MWADARAAGISEDDFWRCTPEELNALLEKIGERDEARERAAALRAALIASEIHNAHRCNSSGKRILWRDTVDIGDYLPQPVKYVDGEELRSIVHDWLGKGRVKQ